MDGPGSEPLESLVRSVPFFRSLDRLDAARVVGALEEVRLAAGALVAEEGAAADALYLVERGRVAISVRAPDGEISLREVEGPDHFGELGLLLTRRTASSRAVTDVVLWRLPRARFEQLVRERPSLSLAVAASLAELLDRRSREFAGAPIVENAPSPLVREEHAAARGARSRVAGAIVALAMPALLWSVAPPAGLEPAAWRLLLLLAGAAVAWITEPVPDFVVALALAGAAGATGLARLDQVFGGFASSSWLLALGALVLAAAMSRSGLLFRAALLSLRTFPATHRGQVLALLCGGAALTPLVPLSVARVAAIAPVTNELARSFGYAPRSRGSASLAFAGLVGYWYFSSVFLTGLATNFFVLELLSPAERARFDWLGWLAAAAPVGIVCFAGAAVVLLALFRPEGAQRRVSDVARRQQRVLGAVSRSERVALAAVAVLLVGLVAQPVLRIEPAWLALAALVIAMAGALDRQGFRAGVDWGFLVLFGVLIGSGGVAQATGLGGWMGERLLALSTVIADPGALLVALALASVALRFLLPSRPAILLLSVAVVPAAAGLGISGWLAGLVVLLAANVWLLPYQGLEYLVTREATDGEAFDDRQGTRLGLALTVVRLVAIAVSVPYWRALGLIG